MDTDEPHELYRRPRHDTGLREAASATIEHKGHEYRILNLDETSWAIRGEDGRTMGSLILLAEEGESGDPVYAGRRPGELESYAEGSDWRGIAKAVINAAG
jgi:hypothetical protein